MWLGKQPRWLHVQYSYKFFFFLWIFTGCSNSVSRNPSKSIVTKARCYANCLTKNAASNETEIPCQTNDCKDCLGPCGSSDSDEAACKQTCIASSSCLESCEFLTKVKNFSSVTNGDNSSTPTPGTPSITNRSLTSISLKWEAVQNTTGSPVYMIEMTFSTSGGNSFWSVYLSEVFVVSEATISLPSLCAKVRSPSFRSDYSPILYKFRVAVLTENSSLSIGQQTVETTLVKPAPVTNVTLDSLVYDPAAVNHLDRIMLTVSWIPPSDYKHLITKYAVRWELDPRKCSGDPYLPENWETSGPNNIFSGNVYTKAKRCSHHFIEVRSMIGCSASDKATLIYTYPGCQNITNFPKKECYKFDPPEAPIEDRIVRNIRPNGAFTVQEDYKFNVNITWDPPAYPHKIVTLYYVWLLEEDRFIDIFVVEGSPSLFLKDLLPRRTYSIKVIPRFADRIPWTERRSSNFTTPSCQNITTNISKSECYKYDPPDAEVEDSVVQNITLLTANDDYQSNMTIIWDPPVYKYRPVNLYLVKITMFRNNSCDGRISASMLGLHEAVTPLLSFMDPEPKTTYRIEVKPKFADDFPKSQNRDINFTIPDLNLKELEVYLKRPRFQLSLNGKSFDVNISWDEPTFNRKLLGYQVSNKVGNREMVVNATEKTHLIIPEVMHGEQLMYWVTPRYELDWLKGTEAKGQDNSPVPPDNDVKVRKIEVVDFVPEQGNTTFSVKFSWIGPVFNVSHYGYFFKYELMGYTKHEIIINGNVTKPELCLPEIRPKETIRLKVRPMFENKNIKKIESQVVETAPAPKMELLAVVGLKHEELVPISSSTFSATVKWEKPLFTQSNVTHYIYRTTKEIKGQMERRSIGLDIQNITTETSVTIDEIYLNEKIDFQVTPVFDAFAITGVATKISIVRTEPKVDAHRSMVSMTPSEIAGLVIGFLLAALICMIFTWRRWREHKVLRKNGLIIDHWEVDGDLVTLEDEIGEGAFGKVYKGTLVKPTNVSPQKFCLKPWKKTAKTISGSETYVVAVKMLHTLPDETVRQDFLEEIQLMKAVGSHKNIVNMVGCCTVEEPMFLLVEYAPYGDLLHYLRKHRKTACKDKRICFNTPMSKAEVGCSNTFTTPEDQIEASLNTEEEEKEDCNEDILTPGNLMAFAWHVCQGMEYLARKGYVHRDLAARNVLIGEKKIAKVSDFGLSRHVYEEKVYHCKRNKKLPFKWMSTEAIFDHTFTTKSDVWAFGVVLWEIATLGGTPYPTIESEELFRLLKNGYRMEKPDTCNEELYKMMQDCWQDNPENRPTFTQILESLETIMQKENPYLDLTAVDESHAEYNVRSFDNMAEESGDDQRDDNVEVVCHKKVFAGDIKENITKNYPQSNNLSLQLDVNTKSETQMGTGSYDCAKNHQDQQTYVLNLKTLETCF